MSAANATGLETPPRPPLALRVRGGPRDGQLVKLSAAKCTIGASPGCTLRLRGRDVRPVHCLIVRGSANTVVRRWSADTLVNGESFDDRPLTLGDRLRCGPVEFEVVRESGESVATFANSELFAAPPFGDIQATQMLPQPGGVHATQVIPQPVGSAPTGTVVLNASPPSPTAGPMTVAMSEVRPLAAQGPMSTPPTLTVALPRPPSDVTSTIMIENPDAAAAKTTLAERERKIGEREAECTRKENTLSDRDAEFARRAAELDTREEQIAAGQRGLEQREQEVARRELEAASRAAEQNAPGEPSPANDGNAAEVTADVAETRRQLEEEREKLDRAKRELDAQHAMRAAEHERWKEDHRQWKAQRQAAENQMEGLQAQVEHQLAEILARRKQIDQDRDAWKSESEQHRRQLDDRAAEVARQAEELKTWRKQLDAEREKAAALIEETSQYEQTCSELADARDRLAQREAEIAAAGEEIARYRAEAARLAGGLAAVGASADRASATSDADAEREKLARQAEELLQLRTQLERQRAQFEARVKAFEAAAEPHEVEAGGDDRADGDGGLSGLSTWALLKDKIDFADDDPVSTPPTAARPQTAATSAPPAAEPTGEDQESIQRYMASLMQRVGGRSTQSPAASRPESSSPAPAALRTDSDAKRDPPTPPERLKPVQRTTKTVTPEEVAAMRELANLNARVAITQHGARRMIPNTIGKATMSVAALAGAAFVFLLGKQHDVRYVSVGATCLVVGAFFLARTMAALRHIFASRRPALAADETNTPAGKKA
jgi:hypothetical protein